MLNDILFFFLLLFNFTWLGCRRQPDCLRPCGDYNSYRAFPNLHQWEQYGQGDIWRKAWWDMEERMQCREGVRWWGGEREREKKQEGGGREGVNSCFLIKQQRSQLIHLICQLEEKHGRNLFTWRRVGGGITERKLLCKKSLEKKQNGEGFVVNGWGNDKKARVGKKKKK